MNLTHRVSALHVVSITFQTDKGLLILRLSIWLEFMNRRNQLSLFEYCLFSYNGEIDRIWVYTVLIVSARSHFMSKTLYKNLLESNHARHPFLITFRIPFCTILPCGICLPHYSGDSLPERKAVMQDIASWLLREFCSWKEMSRACHSSLITYRITFQSSHNTRHL